MTHNRNYSVDVGALVCVEGEGALHVVVRDGSVSEVALNIYEPPRFFEAFLVGRRYDDIPVSRPVSAAYAPSLTRCLRAPLPRTCSA